MSEPFAPLFRNAPPTRPVTITMSELVYARLEVMARKAGRSTSAYAAELFHAAYAARCGPTGDAALDAAVAALAGGEMAP